MTLFELNTILYLMYLIQSVNLRMVLEDINEFEIEFRVVLYIVFSVLSFSAFWVVLWLCFHFSFIMFIILNLLLLLKI